VPAATTKAGRVSGSYCISFLFCYRREAVAGGGRTAEACSTYYCLGFSSAFGRLESDRYITHFRSGLDAVCLKALPRCWGDSREANRSRIASAGG
jgi:hypothetical protein